MGLSWGPHGSAGREDKDKDLTPKDQDKDKDLKYVLKESLRTRTRINIPGVHPFVLCSHSLYFYSASSSPLLGLLRDAPDYSIQIVSELTRQSTQRCQ